MSRRSFIVRSLTSKPVVSALIFGLHNIALDRSIRRRTEACACHSGETRGPHPPPGSSEAPDHPHQADETPCNDEGDQTYDDILEEAEVTRQEECVP